MQAAKIRWKESTDTTTLENVINPNHQHAIQEKTKKRQNKKKPNARKTTNARKKNDDNKDAQTTRPNHNLLIHRYLIHTSHQNPQHNTPPATPTAHFNHFVWPSSSQPCISIQSSFKANDTC
jgi:REP element-mobilizing transposase RayT